MSTKSIFDLLDRTEYPPSPPLLIQKLLHETATTELSPLTLIAHIEEDPQLIDDLLNYLNSALLVSDRTMTSFRKALTEMDSRTVALLALGFSLMNRYREGDCPSLDYLKFWSSSLARAVAARAVAEIQNKFDPDEMFAYGLLSQIGTLALAGLFPEKYQKLSQVDEQDLPNREKELFGTTHSEMTATILQKWGIPESIARSVMFHENPDPHDFLELRSYEISQLLHLSHLLATVLLLEVPLLEKLNHAEQLAEQHTIRENEFSLFYDKLVFHWQEWSRAFRFPSDQCLLYSQVRALEGARNDEQDSPQDIKKTVILIADDDPLTLISLQKILASDDKEILVTDNGKEALQFALKARPHIVIADWHMPEMNGLELCKILRRTSLTRHIYFVMLRSYGTDDELVQAFDAGADDFITKPFTPKVLEARIRSGERLIHYQKTINHDREVIQKYAAQLASANRKLQAMAMTDPLTGLPNRRSAMNRLAAAAAETLRHGGTLSCIMIDIDHFKRINDTFGHENGDTVLKSIASIFHRKARMYDIVSRIGGEEFLVICSRSDLAETRQLAERLRQAVADQQIEIGNTPLQVTISLGVATWRQEFVKGEDLVRFADQALYKAKTNGRNRVELADENM